MGETMRGWTKAVKVVPGGEGFAYVAGQVLVRRQETIELQLAAVRLLGAQLPDEEEPAEYCGVGWVQSGDNYWLVPNYAGDVPGIVARLKGAGIEAQPNHVFFANNRRIQADPGYADPGYADPGYADPGYADPGYADPGYADPGYADPGYADPGYADPGYADPGYADQNRGRRRGRRRWRRQRSHTYASLVYPNPVFARVVYRGQKAVRYEQTGVRPSSAIPLYPGDHVKLPQTADWDRNSAVRISVLDTGWPASEGDLATFYPNKSISAEATGSTPEEAQLDVPDREGKARPADDDSGDETGDSSTAGFDRDDGDYLDPASGHGMFIAGIIQRYVPMAAVRSRRVLSTYGDGSEDDIARAIEEETALEVKPDILNLSFGAYTFDEPGRIADAISKALAAGIVVVAAAGNEGISRKQYPAAFEGVISVGALDRTGPASFSNWGDWVRASAPGVDIPSNFWTFDGKAPGAAGVDRDEFAGWALWSGTSFSTPIVASAIAQMLVLLRTRDQSTPAQTAAELVVDRPGQLSFPNYGTVVNPPPGMAGL